MENNSDLVLRIPQTPKPDYRKVDLDKVKTVSDIVALFKAFYPKGVTFNVDANTEAFEGVKHLIVD